MAFAGFVQLANTIDKVIIGVNSSGTPTDADSFPTYRIYGPAGYLATGNLTFKDMGTITNAPPANPTVYTSNGHNLTVGTQVTVVGVGGNTSANGTGQVTAATTNTFTIGSIDSHLGGAYTSGGTWHATGVYDFSYSPTIGLNFQSGTVYSVYIYGNFSSVATLLELVSFQVT